MKLILPRFRRSRRGGYTLTELALAMMMGIMVAFMLLAIFNQQISFLRIFNAQSFLTTEAPILNNYLSRVMNSAEGFRLYHSVSDVTNNQPQDLKDAKVLMLRFKEQNGTFRASALSFEDPLDENKGLGLYFRSVVDDTNALGIAEWALSNKPTDVTFSVVDGILLARITGPNGEEITYSGTQQL
ncbi:hypothetical protein [Luteolibacter sp. Populi]|uniref:hypothetical protein n=1 Tax=Luteolibacter sp. Populi TaxID=3230487 RepID=UPI003466D996